MTPKSTAGIAAIAFALGALGGSQVNKPVEPKTVATHGSIRLERNAEGCHCFVGEQRDVKKHCREASEMSEADFEAAWVLCEGK